MERREYPEGQSEPRRITGAGRPGPQGQATRTQAAQILKNLIENQEDNT